MHFLRVIPRLDIKGPNLVKGIRLEGLRVMGEPEAFAQAYYNEGADELVFMDIVASLYGRNNLLDIVERTAKRVFIPLTVGGGLRSLDDIRKVLAAGADKVAINTAAIKDPSFIQRAAKRFGSSTIVVSIEAIKKPDGSYEAYTDNGREKTGREVLTWAKQAVELGAGEILLTAIDREGTGEGFDLRLIEILSRHIPIPLLVGGGAGKVEHLVEVAKQGGVQGICLAAMLHYHRLHQDFKRVEPTSLTQLKSKLMAQGVPARV